jgi:heptaprenyl diphosphate synthase
MTPVSRISRLALCTALATLMASVESLIEMPFPFIRLGLANGVTLLVLKWYGLRQGLSVTLIRIVLAGLIIGRIFQPVFFLSLAGGAAATLVMALLIRKEGKWFSFIGISICGAFFHNLAQILTASFLIQQSLGLSLLPVFLLTSMVSGTLIGYFAILVDRSVKKYTPISF